VVALTLIVSLPKGAFLESEGFLEAVEPWAFQFPRDHAGHPGFQTEWWYYTGNLASKAGRPFGFQLTFFRVQLNPVPSVSSSSWRSNQIYFSHLTVSDLEDEEFFVAEKSGRGALSIGGVSSSGPRVRVFLHGWEAVIKGQTHRLRGESDGFAINLELLSGKSPVLHGEKGLSRKGAGAGQASYYYSLTRMNTRGTVRIGKEDFEVSGLSWMDHEFTSNVLSEDQVGWDWMSLQLSDGRELMLYVLKHGDGSVDPFSSGTLVQKGGTSVHLPREAFMLTATDYWRSPRSNARYPSSWRVEILPYNISLKVTPNMKEQELVTEQSTQVTYWEGSVSVTGTASGHGVTGSGYVELTGYAEKFEPAFQTF
jgi:predicted secreted hydrolase